MISILLVNYNDWVNCLRIANQFANNPKYEIIIVDNNSDRNSLIIEQLRSINNVKIIFNDNNCGYSIGNNIAFSNSSGNTIVLSNPDVEFSIDVLDKLLNNLTDHAVSWPDIYINKLEPQQYIYGIEPSPKVKFQLIINKVLPFLFVKSKNEFYSDNIKNRFSSSGCFFAMRRCVAEKIFPLDENIFLYNEEILIGKKMRNNKINCLIDKSCKVYHKEKLSKFNFFLYYQYVKSERYILKNYYEYSLYTDLIFFIRIVFTLKKTLSIKKAFEVFKLCQI